MIDEWDPEFPIFAGDWNLVLNQSLDTHNYIRENNTNARREVHRQMEKYGLIDPWREMHPDSKRFTWHQKGSNPHKFARLDFFLISRTLFPFVTHTNIKAGIQSDHSIIGIKIDFSKFIRGRGFWKLNNSLLKEPSYVELVKNVIIDTTFLYAEKTANFTYTREFLDTLSNEELQNVPLSINDELFFDLLCLEIRGQSIKFATIKSRKEKAEYASLLHNVEYLETKLHSLPDNIQIIQDLQLAKDSLETHHKNEANGAAVRSRAKYYTDGEKPTRLFCSIEKQNGAQKFISSLIIKKNNVDLKIKSQKEVEDHVLGFYKDLYSDHEENRTINSIEDFLGNSITTLPKLSDTEKKSMEGDLTIKEATNYLKRTRNNASPGSSGFTGEFYKMFWINLKRRFINAANYGNSKNKNLSITQRYGVLILLPKGEKDKRLIKNWRPLTLLNTFYKIVSGCIAERIKPNLNKIIHSDQKGFVPGRFMGEVTRTTYDTIQYAKDNNLSGLLLCIDFEKAFDSLSFTFLSNSLDIFNFGPELKQWVHTLLRNFKAVINHCGNISSKFDVSRGCRQGDPLSPYLFILGVEILAHKIRTDSSLKGFTIGNLAHILDAYADDITIYLTPALDNLQNLLLIVKSFYEVSLLKINIEKTSVIWFGKLTNTNRQLYSVIESYCKSQKLVWTNTFKLLGVDFDNNLENMDQNFYTKIEAIDKLLNSWYYRYLTPYGKITVIKALGLSKLSHLVPIIPSINKTMLKKLEKILFSFLWDAKPDKVSRKVTYLPFKRGGLGMVDIYSFWASIRFSWFRRITTSEAFWTVILNTELQKKNTNINKILFFSKGQMLELSKKIPNPFWKNTFNAASVILPMIQFHSPCKFPLFPVISNPLFKIGGQAIKNRIFRAASGLDLQVADLFMEGTDQFYSNERFNEIHSTDINMANYERLKIAILSGISTLGVGLDDAELHIKPRQPLITHIAMKNKKGCHYFYNIIRTKENLKPILSKQEAKWHLELNTVLSLSFWEKSWALLSNLKHNNDMRWIQFQILRNSLKTNKIVSKFIPLVNEKCSFGCNESELISHLFFNCRHVHTFWSELNDFLIDNLSCPIPLNRNSILFGVHRERPDSVINIMILLGKKYIWGTKFRETRPTLLGFKFALGDFLDNLKVVLTIKHKLNEFIELWDHIHMIIKD